MPRVVIALVAVGMMAAGAGCARKDAPAGAPTAVTTSAPPTTVVSTEDTATSTSSSPTSSTAATLPAVLAPARLPSPAPRAADPPPTSAAAVDEVTVRYRLERHTDDEATAGFAAMVEATLTDPRGWWRAGYRLVHDESDDVAVRIVIAEGDEVDRLCLPYDTYGKYSCQNGPVVALNADRWRTATPKWTGDLETYRQMLVNHEVGHLLGLHHPTNQCPTPGRLARVMSQQSTELNGCLPNPWPLDDEVARAARHDLPLAPPPAR